MKYIDPETGENEFRKMLLGKLHSGEPHSGKTHIAQLVTS